MKLKNLISFIKLCLDFLTIKEKIKSFLIAYLLLFSSILVNVELDKLFDIIEISISFKFDFLLLYLSK